MDEQEELPPFLPADPASLDANGSSRFSPEPETSTGTITAADIMSRCSKYDYKSARLKRLLANLKTRRVRDIHVRQGRAASWIYPNHAEAALMTVSGSPSDPPCDQCIREQGPFTECVVIFGEALGSCSNCHYGMGGSHCSFRTVGADSRPPRSEAQSYPVAAIPNFVGTRNSLGPANTARAAPVAPNIGFATSASHIPAAAAGPNEYQFSSLFTGFDFDAMMSEWLPANEATAAQPSQLLTDLGHNITESGLAPDSGSSTTRPSPLSMLFDARAATSGQSPTAVPAAITVADMASWSPQRLRREAMIFRLWAENYNLEAANYEALADLYGERGE